MGCTWSGLNALYEVVGSGTDVWVNKRRFRIQRRLGEGGFAFVYLVREQPGEQQPWEEPKDPSHISDLAKGRTKQGIHVRSKVKRSPQALWLKGKFAIAQVQRESKDSSHISENGLYALKKVLVQTEEQLELVKHEIHVLTLFNHPNLIPLLDYSIISVKGGLPEGTWNQEAYLLFPVYLDGTVLDCLTEMQSTKTFFPTITVLHIFQQICAGLMHMHTHDPPYAHNDLKPGNVLLIKRPNQPPKAVIMDFGSATPAQKQVRSRAEALVVQEWAAQHCSAPYRAPELWDCPSHTDVDERSDIWSLGCTLFALMYGVSPFEYCLGEQGGSLQLAAMSGIVKWPPGPNPPYPETLRQFVTWMLQPSVELRPTIADISLHVDKLLAKFDNGDDV